MAQVCHHKPQSAAEDDATALVLHLERRSPFKTHPMGDLHSSISTKNVFVRIIAE